MTKEIANIILQFLHRVELKGAEVPAFTKAVQELNAILKMEDEKEQEED